MAVRRQSCIAITPSLNAITPSLNAIIESLNTITQSRNYSMQSPNPPVTQSLNGRASHVLSLVAYGALTLALFWPVAANPGAIVPFDLGDPLLSTWTLWWNARVGPFTSEWWNGLAFFPERETLTFSDHRVGLGMISTPLLWLGVSPLASHNIVFLLSFFLSASAAYALCYVLTGSRWAAFIGGLIFGFNPFRAGHLPHLELLAAYWLPVVFLALHQWVNTRHRRWLVLLTVAVAMQALTSGYYFAFAMVLIGLWLVWFMPRTWRPAQYTAVTVALIVPVLAAMPIFLKYRDAHDRMGLSRTIVEIEQFSADLVGLVTAATPLALWNSPPQWQLPEQELMPGATAVLLVVAALFASGTAAVSTAPLRWRRLRLATLVIAGGAAGVALIPIVHGPVAFDLAGMHVSVSHAYKPLSIATLLFGGWVLTSWRVRQAWRLQSPFAFYVLASLAMWILALGPTARLLGERLLYKAPYAWLMFLPGFRDEFRAPARYGMLATLTLAAAAALAVSRLTAGRRPIVRGVAAGALAMAIVVESWIDPLPAVQPPPALTMPPAVPPRAVVLELPIGVYEDATAMYHSIDHQRPTINGMSGYQPPHYGILRSALEEDRVEALGALAAHRDIAIFVRRDERTYALASLLKTHAQARMVAETDTHLVLLRDQSVLAKPPPVATATLVAPHGLTSGDNPDHLGLMTDGDRLTTWSTLEPQRGDESFTADVGDTLMVEAVTLALGKSFTAFPRTLAVDVSEDGIAWTETWRGDTAERSVAAAIEDPRHVTVRFPFAALPARYVRVRQLGHSTQPWAVSEFRVIARR
jgi:hypothetical protein